MLRRCFFPLFVSLASALSAQEVASPNPMPTMPDVSSDGLVGQVEFCAANGGLYEQLGSGGHAFNVTVEGGTAPNTNLHLYGDASYVRELKRQVRWNETADFFWVYPYLTADSVGGSLKVEHYSFAGGFVRSGSLFSWGAHASYRAGLQYRSIDPRPRNVTSMLGFSLGGAMAPAALNGWTLHVSVDALKYKQDNELKFYSEKGQDKVFHLLGLAQHYVRFAGANLSSFYDGGRWGVSFGADCGNDRRCLVGLFSYHLQKVLNLNNDLPICNLSERGGSFSFEWLDWRLSGLLSKRLGSEDIYGEASGGDSYNRIVSLSQYQLIKGSVSCGIDRPLRNNNFRISGGLSYDSHKESYVSPAQQLVVRKMAEECSLLFSRLSSQRRCLQNFSLSVSHDWALSSSLVMPVGVGRDRVLDLLVDRNFVGLRNPGFEAGGSVVFLWPLGDSCNAVSACLSYDYDFMTEFHSCSLTLGFVRVAK